MQAAEDAMRLDAVDVTFPDGTAAVAGVTFALDAAEFVTIVGPSGCGKSTLLRVVAGLTPPTSGAVHARREHLAYVFQDATLLPWRTVQKNVELVGELEGLARDEREERTSAALDLVGLRAFHDHYPRTLSGGMRMRVSLARALTLKPKLFLLDEPFGALDELTRDHLNDELLRLHLDQGFAALFVTHSVVEAIYLSKRVLVMSARPGRIVRSFAIPFAYPRVPDLRFSAEFGALAAEVSACLRAHADQGAT